MPAHPESGLQPLKKLIHFALVIEITIDEVSRVKKFTCPTCNAACGLLVEVKLNKVISIKPDKDHPLSRGFCCPKGLALGPITNDKDRVRKPLKRVGDAFQEISWKQAIHEIAKKVLSIREASPHSIAYYMGTNSLHHYAHALFVTGFMRALGSKNMYNAGSVDNNNKFVAQYFLYGSSVIMPIPDIPNTDLLIILGSNPAVTRMSLAHCPNIVRELKMIKKRGAEIYLIDPRRNETAQIFTEKGDEHYIPIYPDTDAFFLLAMINVIFREKLEDEEYLKANTTGYEILKELVQEFTPELAEKCCKIPAETIYQLARKFVRTKRAVIYARLGTCLSTFSTLNAWAIEVINIIAGKFDRHGGQIFGRSIINTTKLGKLLGLGTYDTSRSRIGNYPNVMGAFPLGILAREILTPGNRVRALFISGGNPALSSPNSTEIQQALKKLEICVVLDFYINETALLAADYILPVRTPLENSEIDMFNLNYQVYPRIEYSHAVITPEKYGPKPEWEILLSLARVMKLPIFGNKILDAIPRLFRYIGKEFDPEILVRIFLFLGQVLEKRFPHLSTGTLSLKKLKKKETVLLGKNEYGVSKKFLMTDDKKIHLMDVLIEEQIKECWIALEKRIEENRTRKIPENEFVVIGRRSLKTMNSWMHNVDFLWRKKQEPKLLINDQDASRLNLTQGEVVTLENKIGSIKIPIEITEDVMPGVVCYPHGWGHKNPKLSFANKHPGENINVLTNSHELEKLSGMPLMNGYRVRLSK